MKAPGSIVLDSSLVVAHFNELANWMTVIQAWNTPRYWQRNIVDRKIERRRMVGAGCS